MVDPICEHEFYFYPEPHNEAGWKCINCKLQPGEPPGFSPNLDRLKCRTKVDGLLLDLHNHDFVSVSNGDCGDGLGAMVAERCEREGRFDQYSILLFILEAMTKSHADYWKKISDGILAGNDPRHRCDCGKLATSYTFKDGKETRRCSGCWSKGTEGPF
jgi:hypothetical protein